MEETELKSLKLSIVSPARSLYEGNVDMVRVPAHDGLMGIQPNHAPFMGLLGYGLLTFRGIDGEQQFIIDGGFVEVSGNRVTVLANSAEPLSEVNRELAKQALTEALEMKATGDEEIEFRMERQMAARSRIQHTSH